MTLQGEHPFLQVPMMAMLKSNSHINLLLMAMPVAVDLAGNEPRLFLVLCYFRELV